MRKATVLIVALLVLALFAGAALAGNGEAKAKRPRNVKGAIKAIDLEAGTIDFQTKKGQLTVQVADATKIKKNGRRAALDALGLGDKGRIKYKKTADDTLAALQIFVKTPVMHGTIAEVAEGSVVLKNKKATNTFLVDEDTIVYKDGVEVPLSDLVVGDHGKIGYNLLEDGSHVAKKIKASSRED